MRASQMRVPSAAVDRSRAPSGLHATDDTDAVLYPWLLERTRNEAMLEAQSPEAQIWLRKINDATQKLSYSGTFVYQNGSRSETSRITRYVDARGDIEKLEVMDGVPREIVRTKDMVRCYLPDSRVVKVDRRTERGFPALEDILDESRPLFAALERGDCSRWPAGIYSRAWVRNYALVVGLDPEVSGAAEAAPAPEEVQPPEAAQIPDGAQAPEPVQAPEAAQAAEAAPAPDRWPQSTRRRREAVTVRSHPSPSTLMATSGRSCASERSRPGRIRGRARLSGSCARPTAASQRPLP